MLTFWMRKLRAPLSYSIFTHSILHVSTSTILAALLPVMSDHTPTSFVPIHCVYNVLPASTWMLSFPTAEKYAGSCDSMIEGNGRGVRRFEHVPPERAKGCRVVFVYPARYTGQATPPSPTLTISV